MIAKCCDTISIASDGWSKIYGKEAWGTYRRLTNHALGAISYKLHKPEGMADAYYLVGSRESGWKVGRLSC